MNTVIIKMNDFYSMKDARVKVNRGEYVNVCVMSMGRKGLSSKPAASCLL